MISLFWVSLFIIFYTFLGYGILLYLMVRLRRVFRGRRIPHENSLISCTLVVAAYNEADFIREKIHNTLLLDYPEDKLSLLFITDGSDDGTPDIIAVESRIKLMHQADRQGKVAAIHRAIKEVQSEIVIFTDANTLLNKDAVSRIARHYSDRQVGAVAGEKRIRTGSTADAGAAGEGFYWKYESTLKKWDSELYSVVGAAGELFSVRRSLYQPVANDVILDDFMISMQIAMQGYRIVYEPEAYAIESSSENVTEELKRKIRIAAGGIQSIIRLRELLNIFKYGVLSFQYISHRVLRWTITPFLLLLVFILNIFLLFHSQQNIYWILFFCQSVFYILAFLGFLLERKKLRVKVMFIPYYFCVMNYAVIMGIRRYLRGGQSAIWEKAKRAGGI